MGSEADEDVTGRNARGVELDDAENWAGKGERNGSEGISSGGDEGSNVTLTESCDPENGWENQDQ